MLRQVSGLAKSLGKDSHCVSTFCYLQGWFHLEDASPHGKKLADSNNLDYILPCSYLIGARLPEAISSEG